MAILVIGLGSMGIRRIRVLKALGEFDILGFDTDPNRLASAVADLSVGIASSPLEIRDAPFLELVIISTPPDAHAEYLAHFLLVGIPAFVEASVTELPELEAVRASEGFQDALVFPSLTMLFFDQILKLQEILSSIGEVLLLTYHTGQHVEDWHPWETPEEYYVSNPVTGACRELVPFEFGWLVKIFGNVVPTASNISFLGLDALSIASIYSIQAELGPKKIRASLVVEVLSRPEATRTLHIVGELGAISYSELTRELILKTKSKTQVCTFPPPTHSDVGINPDHPYREELAACLRAIRTGERNLFPNTLDEDIYILRILAEVEKIAT